MTRVDFYVLDDTTADKRIDMVCRLTEKALSQSQTVYIHTEDSVLAAKVDSALWQFRSDSFIPHRTVEDGDSNSTQESVEIGHTTTPRIGHTVLINLGHEVPPFFSSFERTLEIVNQQDTVRSTGRERYSYYQQRGYPLKHHKL